VNPECLDAARALKPIYERPVFGRSVMLFENVDRDQVDALGEVRRPSIADLFVAVLGRDSTEQGAGKSAVRNQRSEIHSPQSEVEETK
jgi:ABC-2 type transport system ATP-binding protein